MLRQWLRHALPLLAALPTPGALAAERMVAPLQAGAQDVGAGTASAPYKSLSYAMSQLQPGDHLVIAAGTYRDALLFPKAWFRAAAPLPNAGSAARIQPITAETVIEGRGRVIIKGSDVVDGWRALDGGRFVKPWPEETQQVFIDGKPLTQLGGTIFGGFPETPGHPLLALHKTQKGIWPGRRDGDQNSMPTNSFYYDRAGRALYLRPALPALSGHQVEVSRRPVLLAGTGLLGITVKNLEFQHSNTSTTHRGGLITLSGQFITLDNLHVSLADSTGISLIGDDITLRNSSSNDGGQLGINARGKRMRLIANETSGNNTRGFNKYWEAGGAKFIGNGGLHDSLVSGHKALGNFGDGIWFDWKNRNNTVENSLAAYNHGFGIHYEASDRGCILNNVTVGNTQRGIYLPHASDSVVAFNLVAGNGLQGIAIVDEGRRDPDGTFDFSARGNKVFSNVIAWNASPLVLPSNISDNVSDGNVYIGNGAQTRPGLGWRHMFQEELPLWTQRTRQDSHSLRMDTPIDDAFRNSLTAHKEYPDLGWYQTLRETMKPLAVNPQWLTLVPDITDRRAGPTLFPGPNEASR